MDICLESFDYTVVNEGRIKEAFKAVIKKLVDRLKIVLDGIQQIVAKLKDQKYKELYEKISKHNFKLTKKGEEGIVTLKTTPDLFPKEKMEQIYNKYDEIAGRDAGDIICNYVDKLNNRHAEEPSEATLAIAIYFNSLNLSGSHEIKYSDLNMEQIFFNFNNHTPKASEIRFDKLKIKSAMNLIKSIDSGSFFANEKEVTENMRTKIINVIRAYIVLWTAYLNMCADEITVLQYAAKHIDTKAKSKDLDESESKEESYNFCSIR